MSETPQTPVAGWQRKVAGFISGQTVSLFGSMLVQYVLVWYVTLETRSGMMMMLSTLAGFAPQVLISLFAGVWADRYPRKLLILVADAGIALATLVMAILFALGHGSIWLIFAVTAIRSAGTGVQIPAVQAMIPQLVPTEQLTRVGGIHGSIQSIMQLLAPALSGALMATVPLQVIFGLDVVSAIIGICILAGIKIPVHAKAMQQQATSALHDMSEGLRYLRHNRFLKAFIVFDAICMFFIAPAAFLSPLMITRTFGDQVWRLTANELVFAAGAILGGVLIAAWGGFKNRMHTIVLSTLVFGIMTAMLGLPVPFTVYLLFMGVVGISMPLFSTPATVLMQEHVDTDMQGRVFSLIQVATSCMMPLGMMIFGPLADVIRIETLFIVSGIALTAIGVVMLSYKGFRQDAIQL